MNNFNKSTIPFFHLKLTLLSFSETCELIVERIKNKSKTIHTCINANKLMLSENDSDVRNAILKADIVSADGITVKFLAKIINVDVPERVTGIDLMYTLIYEAEKNGFGVFFLGSQLKILEKLTDELRRKFPRLNIVGTNDGYFASSETSQIIEKINNSKAELLFIGMSSPIKEKFILENKDKINSYLVMGVGGSFDVISGNKRRSPKFIQKIGFEWFYRMIQEPWRLSKRYMKNFFYIIKLSLQRNKI